MRRPPAPRPARRRARAAGGLLLSLGLTASCALQNPAPQRESSAAPSQEVVLATHDSWAMPKKVLQAFTDQTGYDVTVQPAGDAGALTNKLVLTKGSPIADVAYGIDNTFASRAVDEGVLAAYAPQDGLGAAYEPQDATAADQLTPVDYSDVCVNVDDRWFAKNDIDPPTSFEDLIDPTYRGLFVTPGPPTSSPGLAFLIATVSKFGEADWQDYWQALLDDNGAKVTAGWSDAYQVDFTAGGGGGDRPIVLSYASSPPFTIPEGQTRPTTSALLDTCFRQVEYAAVLEGSENPEGAQALVDFMQGPEFQAALPESMYVYPVDPETPLPAAWEKWATPAADPWPMPEGTISDLRADWLRAWADLAGQ